MLRSSNLSVCWMRISTSCRRIRGSRLGMELEVVLVCLRGAPLLLADAYCFAGRPFAWQEMMLVLAMTLQYFNFTPDDPQYSLQISSTLTIKPKDFYMRASVREGWTARAIEQSLTGQQPVAASVRVVKSQWINSIANRLAALESTKRTRGRRSHRQTSHYPLRQ